MEVMAGMADLIVVGEISKVHVTSTYDFTITSVIKGSAKSIIKVNMFKEWTCDHRAKKAESGQRLLLFLQKDMFGTYEIINGSTGEKFIENNQLEIVINEKIPTVDELTLGLKLFTSCYQLKGKEYDFGNTTFIQLKSTDEIKELSAKSEITSWLVDRVKNYQVEVK